MKKPGNFCDVFFFRLRMLIFLFEPIFLFLVIFKALAPSPGPEHDRGRLEEVRGTLTGTWPG